FSFLRPAGLPQRNSKIEVSQRSGRIKTHGRSKRRLGRGKILSSHVGNPKVEPRVERLRIERYRFLEGGDRLVNPVQPDILNTKVVVRMNVFGVDRDCEFKLFDRFRSLAAFGKSNRSLVGFARFCRDGRRLPRGHGTTSALQSSSALLFRIEI